MECVIVNLKLFMNLGMHVCFVGCVKIQSSCSCDGSLFSQRSSKGSILIFQNWSIL